MLFIVLGLAIGLAALANFFAYSGRSERAGQGTAAIGGPFTMTAQDGRIVSDKDLAGHPYLVFFGYTHCPDFCPTTLTEISAAFKAMGDDKKIAALFVTVDPERDTPDMMKTYLESFDPRIIGLSADAEKTRAMAKAFKVYFKKRATENDDYTMDHTGVVYLMDKNGRFVNAFNSAQPAKQAASELEKYL
ncbi:MAG: SCO family protein [Methylocella sp.]